MDPLAHRVAARFRTAGIRVIQRKGEYPTELLSDMAKAIAKRIGVANRDITIRFGTKSGRNDTGVGGEHTFFKGGKHAIYINKNWILQTQMSTVAHEMEHALQNANGRLYSGYNEWTWEGEDWPGNTPYKRRPWEQEAHRAERHGIAVFNEFKSRGLIPKTRSEKLLDDMEARGDIPARGKPVSEMSREEVLEWVAKNRV